MWSTPSSFAPASSFSRLVSFTLPSDNWRVFSDEFTIGHSSSCLHDNCKRATSGQLVSQGFSSSPITITFTFFLSLLFLSSSLLHQWRRVQRDTDNIDWPRWWMKKRKDNQAKETHKRAREERKERKEKKKRPMNKESKRKHLMQLHVPLYTHQASHRQSLLSPLVVSCLLRLSLVVVSFFIQQNQMQIHYSCKRWQVELKDVLILRLLTSTVHLIE